MRRYQDGEIEWENCTYHRRWYGVGARNISAFCPRRGAIICSNISISDVEETVRLITEAGGNARALHHDVSRPEDWDAIAASVRDTEGRLDVLVNNAGIAPIGTIESANLDQWRACMAVNADGVFLGCKHGVALMKRHGGGSIVNLSSIDGIIGESELLAY
jgi:3(or 17)beta-hydroxysteroid dehydrogenase